MKKLWKGFKESVLNFVADYGQAKLNQNGVDTKSFVKDKKENE